MSARVAFSLLVGLVAPATLQAQQTAFGPPSDTMYLEVITHNHSSIERARDTVSSWRVGVQIVQEQWHQEDSDWVVDVHVDGVTQPSDTRTWTTRVSKSGAAESRPRLSAPSTFSLPATLALQAGAIAIDTTASAAVLGSDSTKRPAAVVSPARDSVTRVFDTLGTSAAEVVVDLHLQYRVPVHTTTGVMESTDTMTMNGTFHSVYWIAVANHWVLASVVRLTLRGEPMQGQAPGGMLARVSEVVNSTRRITAAQAQLALRPLPGRDTSMTKTTATTVEGRPDFSHMQPEETHTEGVSIASDTMSIDAGVRRADATSGTVHAAYKGAALLSYDAVWSDTALRENRQHIQAHDLTAPRSAWAVAEHDMPEMLAPLARTYSSDTLRHDIAIYRPTSGRWELGWLQVHRKGPPTDAGLVVSVQMDGESEETGLIFSPDGTLLASSLAGPPVVNRLPADGSPREQELYRVLGDVGATDGP